MYHLFHLGFFKWGRCVQKVCWGEEEAAENSSRCRASSKVRWSGLEMQMLQITHTRNYSWYTGVSSENSSWFSEKKTVWDKVICFFLATCCNPTLLKSKRYVFSLLIWVLKCSNTVWAESGKCGFVFSIFEQFSCISLKLLKQHLNHSCHTNWLGTIYFKCKIASSRIHKMDN